MSSPKTIDDVLLHRFFDGDLDESEAAEVRAAVEGDPDLRAKLEGLEEVRGLIRAIAAKDSADLASDALWARIAGELPGEHEEPAARPEAPAAARKPALRAISGGASTSAPVRGPAQEPRVLPLILATLAIAAVALLAIWTTPGGPDESLATTETAGEPTSPRPPTPPEPAPEEEVFARTEILEVDFGPNSGTIFAVEGDHEGERFAVVWLADVDPSQVPTP